MELVQRLPREEFQPHLLVLESPPPPHESELVSRLFESGTPLEFFDAESLWNAPRTIGRLKRSLQALRPVLVQSFLAHANIAAAYAARCAGVRPIVTGIRVAERRHNLHAWLARRTERWVARHVCVSHSVAEFAIHNMRLDPRKVMVIPNGVDVEKFTTATPLTREELDLPGDAQIVLHVGRLDMQKRIDWLMTSFSEAQAQLPDAYLLLAGAGPSQVYLAKLAARLGIAGRVRFLGWRADVPQLLATCDLLALTSAWEGMPNVILEAMATGRPVLVTEVEGAREILGPLAESQLVARDDRAAFNQRFVDLLRDSSLRSRLGQENQNRVRRRFSLNETTQKYLQLYRQLLGSGSV